MKQARPGRAVCKFSRKSSKCKNVKLRESEKILCDTVAARVLLREKMSYMYAVLSWLSKVNGKLIMIC